MFVAHLLAVADWQSIAPWTAAQDVQASAFADGSNYEVNWAGPDRSWLPSPDWGRRGLRRRERGRTRRPGQLLRAPR